LGVQRSGKIILTVGGRGHRLPYYRGLPARKAPEEYVFPDRSKPMNRLAVVAKTEGHDFRETIRESATPPLTAGRSVVLVGTSEQAVANSEVALFATVSS
jgi:hypothetical protein